MATGLTVEAPVIKDKEIVKPLLCGPGPCDISPAVANALSMPVLSPSCDDYYKVLDDIRAGLKYVFQTNSQMVFAVSGSGHSGMETIISNLVAPGETLLIAARGIWDERAFIMATRYGIKPIVTRVQIHETFSLDHLESSIIEHRPVALFITHGDSSTGTIQNLRGLGEICHRYGTLLLVDAVVSLIGEPFFMDEWQVDAVYSSAQKAVGGPAGIAPVAFSSRAMHKINNRKHEPPFYFDVKPLAKQWNCYENNFRFYHHTLSSPLLWALRESLKEIIKETLPRSWARHAATTSHFHKRIEQLPLKLLVPKHKDRLVTVTTIVLPDEYDHMEFYKHMRAKYDILILVGLGPTEGKAMRVGLMGMNSTVEIADAVADAMAATLSDLKKSTILNN